jgi:threonine aldolase
VERVNLFSDTQTRPTDGMRRAIAEAEVGDEQRFADPTTTRLEQRVAELLGHDAALFLPSGTMCNQIAIRLHTRPGGDELIAAANSHPVNYEAGGPALFGSAMVRTIDTPTGVFEPDQLAAAIRPAGDRYAPRSRLVSVEQTTNVGGGRVWPLETVRAVVDLAHEHDMRAHLDGARLMNAVVATGTPAADWAAGFDTAWIDFTKGLGAPVGAVLAGSRELIDEAWRYKQMIGGALRQSGIVAAACLYALDHHVDRLAEDHDNARALAQGLAELPGFTVQPPDTNIVMAEVADAPQLVGELWDRGVEVTPMSPTHIRCVTHLDADAAGIERALAAFREVAG